MQLHNTHHAGPYADLQMGSSFLQNVELYLLTGEYLQIQSYTHTFVHKQLVTPSAQQLVKHLLCKTTGTELLLYTKAWLVSQLHPKLVKMGIAINNLIFLSGSCCSLSLSAFAQDGPWHRYVTPSHL